MTSITLRNEQRRRNPMNNNVLNNFAKRLNEVLRTLGITMKEMSEALGFPVSFISELCSGKKATPSTAFLFNIAKVYRVSLDFLLMGEGEMFLPAKKA
jgi:transcriptional regulator with XRE-family HTH domain